MHLEDGYKPAEVPAGLRTDRDPDVLHELIFRYLQLALKSKYNRREHADYCKITMICWCNYHD